MIIEEKQPFLSGGVLSKYSSGKMNSKTSGMPSSKTTKKYDLVSWSTPYGGLQATYIIWKFKKMFPNQLLADRIKNWPFHTSIGLKDDFPNFNMESSRAAAKVHQDKRQKILDEMKNIIIQKNMLSLSPLQKLEMYEEMKYRQFKNEMSGNFRLMKKWFPWLLKKRVYKPKKRSPEKLRRQNARRKLKKQQKKIKTSTTSVATIKSINSVRK